ncbi:MAG: hypothetical protein J7K72_02575 [Candidatus Aenigmarchaeota archaeon]|nr:hypothetical protein [Candidatus Aenigmarchaeota archaeon]
MAKRGFYKKTIKNALLIFDLLKKFGEDGELLTISKISKITGLHKWTVSRTIDIYMSPFVEIITPDGFEDVGLNIKFVRLKNPNVTKLQVMRFLKLRGTLTF